MGPRPRVKDSQILGTLFLRMAAKILTLIYSIKGLQVEEWGVEQGSSEAVEAGSRLSGSTWVPCS